MLHREGFRQRKCVLSVTPARLDRVIDAGYDPALGARAMKRAVERQVTQPAAARLAALPVDRFTVVSVYSASELGADGPDHLEVDVRALEFAAPMNPPETERPPLDRLDQPDAALWKPSTKVTDRSNTRPSSPADGGRRRAGRGGPAGAVRSRAG